MQSDSRDRRKRQPNQRCLVRPADKAPPEGMRYVEAMQWLSNDKIAIIGTQNISLIETLIIDVTSGKEAADIVNNGGREPVFSADGSHFAYLDGTPHFSPRESWRPTLNVDDKSVFPEAGIQVTFLSQPRWLGAGDELAILAQDHQSKKVSLVIWQASGALSKISLDFAPGKLVDLFGNGTAIYVKSDSRAWRVQDDSFTEVPMESAVNPLDEAKLEAKRLETIVHDASGDNDADFSCQSCPLATLPRSRSLNK
jgi:hypothetical protein